MSKSFHFNPDEDYEYTDYEDKKELKRQRKLAQKLKMKEFEDVTPSNSPIVQRRLPGNYKP